MNPATDRQTLVMIVLELYLTAGDRLKTSMATCLECGMISRDEFHKTMVYVDSFINFNMDPIIKECPELVEEAQWFKWAYENINELKAAHKGMTS